MELRSRSRSKTPFQQHKYQEEYMVEGMNHVTVTSTRSTRQSTLIKSSGEVSSTSDYAISSSSRSGRSRRSAAAAVLSKTSDYSSEEGDFDTKHITENQKNQIIEDAKAAANGNSHISALDLYRKAGRYWDKYPKTDWTYSPHSKDRVEIAPGVVQMPNMSRPTIHSSTNTESSYLRGNNTSTYSMIKERFFSPNKSKDVNDSYHLHRRRISESSTLSSSSSVVVVIKKLFITIFTSILWLFTSVYSTHNMVILWIAKRIHNFASRIMLMDTWLLKRRSNGSKRNRILALCLIPLLLIAGWWLFSSFADNIYTSYLNYTTATTTPIIGSINTQPEVNFGQQYQAPPPPSPSVIDASDELITKIIHHPNIQNIINNLHTSNNADLLRMIENLQKEIVKVKDDLTKTQTDHNDDLNRLISQYRLESRQNYARLSLEMKKCCSKPDINLESHILKVLGDVLNNPEYLAKQEGLSEYLHSVFVAKRELDLILSNFTMKHPQIDLDQLMSDASDKIMSEVVVKLSKEIDHSGLTDERIQSIVKRSLAIYDADKTGLVDYAMESMGGQVLSTRCTEIYQSGSPVISIMGIPLWYPSTTPRIAITPGIQPGECWAFQNFPGFLIVQMAKPVKIEAFSLEHISRLLVPDGRIDSAPKDFEVYGLLSEDDKNPTLLGEFQYDYNGEPIQYFEAQQRGLIFDIVELRIKSNHGNPNYTCLYRFRVHGKVGTL